MKLKSYSIILYGSWIEVLDCFITDKNIEDDANSVEKYIKEELGLYFPKEKIKDLEEKLKQIFDWLRKDIEKNTNKYFREMRKKLEIRKGTNKGEKIEK